MKKLLLLSVIVLFSAYAGNLFATPVPVKILSSYFSISGSIEGDEFPFGPIPLSAYYNSYADSGSIPLADGVTCGGLYDNGAYASSSAGFFSVYTFAWGSMFGSGLPLAIADVMFQPLSPMNQLTIYYDGVPWNPTLFSGSIELKDLTDGIQIFSQAVPNLGVIQWTAGSYLIDYSFQTNNVYELYLSAQSGSNYDPAYLHIWTNDMTAAVPEPTTVLLLGLGLMGLAGVRRKIKKLDRSIRSKQKAGSN